MTPIHFEKQLQAGSALVTSLLLLVVLTLLAVTALESTVMEERMSNNTRQKIIAQQAAETALRRAETFLQDNVSLQTHLVKFDGSATEQTLGLYNSTLSGTSVLDWNTNNAANWKNEKSVAINADPNAPRFVISYVGRAGQHLLNYGSYSNTLPDLRPHAFSITAIGYGADGNTRVVLTSNFQRMLN